MLTNWGKGAEMPSGEKGLRTVKNSDSSLFSVGEMEGVG
jgi:hypothetical protein